MSELYCWNPYGRLMCLALVLFTFGLVATACTQQQAVSTLQVTSALTTVRADYARAHDTLERRLAQLPETDAMQWRALLRQADEFKATVETLRATATVPTEESMAALYETGVGIWARAHTLIAPDLKNLPINDQILLRQFDMSLRRLAKLYQEWIASPGAAHQAEMAAAGLELVRLALQLGVAVL